MRFVDHYEVPWVLGHEVRFIGREVVRADDDVVCLVKGVGLSFFDHSVEAGGFQNDRWDMEFVVKLLCPLLSKCGWHNDQNSPASLSPALRKY